MNDRPRESSASSEPVLQRRTSEGVATLVLNRPRQYNALSRTMLDAPVALDWGLVNRVAPAERLMESAHELADNLKSKPREVLALGKALFYRQLETSMGAAYNDASRTIARNMAGDIAREGVDAFLAKIPPNWKP